MVVVQVTADGSLRINQRAVEWNDLGPRLQEIFKMRAQRVAFIHGDNGLEFRHIARAIDIMKGAGIDAVGLLTKL